MVNMFLSRWREFAGDHPTDGLACSWTLSYGGRIGLPCSRRRKSCGSSSGEPCTKRRPGSAGIHSPEIFRQAKVSVAGLAPATEVPCRAGMFALHCATNAPKVCGSETNESKQMRKKNTSLQKLETLLSFLYEEGTFVSAILFLSFSISATPTHPDSGTSVTVERDSAPRSVGSFCHGFEPQYRCPGQTEDMKARDHLLWTDFTKTKPRHNFPAFEHRPNKPLSADFSVETDSISRFSPLKHLAAWYPLVHHSLRTFEGPIRTSVNLWLKKLFTLRNDLQHKAAVGSDPRSHDNGLYPAPTPAFKPEHLEYVLHKITSPRNCCIS
ncbi:hypothetical protein PoB_003392600 [Plakobranchus ocellatus]|uniref:Uncharacterized protein n=1 Tax=Plakobranchus ocellatus TaxID=259542 RepID=A0AAV4A874_9GAST|nr:hypothetical protein PoB_003392600 [Plakobranchus ocellatus]